MLDEAHQNIQHLCCIYNLLCYYNCINNEQEDSVKYSEFLRWLKSQGVMIENARGGGSHRKATINGRMSIFPFHGSKEIPEGTRKSIIKDLGL
ncbi:type II toxin-antitoxin system HicA family toxin [Citrobacter freundii]|uniref:type II toxin-antitoxin system HicA family toxin n=1 Tax=Citrobacter freundii TaxID=546 RepID=UPI0027D207C6